MSYKPEEIAPNQIEHGDVLYLPDVEGTFAYVVEVIPGGVGEQLVSVRMVGAKQDEETTIGIPWLNSVMRVGSAVK